MKKALRRKIPVDNIEIFFFFITLLVLVEVGLWILERTDLFMNGFG